MPNFFNILDFTNAVQTQQPSTLAEGVDIAIGTSTGTRIGTDPAQKLALYGATPVAQRSAYTQTYSIADRVFAAYTSNPESSAYTGINNLQAGTVYATVADLNALRVAYENLRVFCEDGMQMLNSVVDDLQATGIAG